MDNRRRLNSGREDFTSYPDGHRFSEGTWHTTPSGMFFRAIREIGSPVYPPDMHISNDETGHAALNVHLGWAASDSTEVEFTLPRVQGRRLIRCVFDGIRTKSAGPEPTSFVFHLNLFDSNNQLWQTIRFFDIDDATTSIALPVTIQGLSLQSVAIEAEPGVLDVPPMEIGQLEWEYTDWAPSWESFGSHHRRHLGLG